MSSNVIDRSAFRYVVSTRNTDKTTSHIEQILDYCYDLNDANQSNDIQQFRRIMQKDYYKKTYLDCFNHPEQIDVTAIIPTRNRAPYSLDTTKGNYNPLKICVLSILEQKPKIKEIVVVNDHSSDYTISISEQLQSLAVKKGIGFKIKSNRQRMGSSTSRNIGVKKANSDMVFFMDDDCVAPPYAIFGLYKTFRALQEKGNTVGAVHAPVYQRSTYPSITISREDIGILDIEECKMTSNFDKFPLEYIKNEEFIDEQKKILEPIEIHNLAGCFLMSRHVFKQIRGFDPLEWNNSYGEETHLAKKLTKQGYHLFFSPDPKMGLFHGRFGDPSNIRQDAFIARIHRNEKLVSGISLSEFVKICMQENNNTGNRVSKEYWWYCRFLSLYTIFFDSDRLCEMTHKFLEITKTFVEKNDTSKFSGGKKLLIDDHTTRQNIAVNSYLDAKKYLRIHD